MKTRPPVINQKIHRDIHQTYKQNFDISSEALRREVSSMGGKIHALLSRAHGTERRSGRLPGARELIPPGYLQPGKGKRSLKFINNRGRVTVFHGWTSLI
jgi:hypothetical protein